ncbi:MAG TPA: helix-turn-helix domain-containing protein [Pedobacter sp.]|nr:helix-turn-helix domain-containing protein [Pedobacter sp.]
MKTILERIEVLFIGFLEEWRRDKEEAKLVNAPLEEWLRADEVMRVLSISRRTLYNYYIDGAFKTRRIGGTVFYAKASVMRFT